MALEFQKQKEDMEKEYESILREMAINTSAQIDQYNTELKSLKDLVEKERTCASAAVEANKRA